MTAPTSLPASSPHAVDQAPADRGTARPAQGLVLVALLLTFLLDFRLARAFVLLLPLGAVFVLLRTRSAHVLTARLPIAVLAFVGWAAASWIWSADQPSTVRGVVQLVCLAAPAVVGGMLVDLDELRRVTTVAVKLVLGACVLSLVVAPGWATAPLPGDPVAGWSAIFGHKNALGFFCLYAAVALFFDRSRLRWLWLLSALALLVGSQSSTALALVVFVTGLLLWRVSTQAFLAAHSRSAYALLSAAAVGVGLASLALRPSLATDALGRDLTLTGRTEIWTPVQRQISLHPEVGLGWGGVWQPTSAPTLEMWREARFEAFYAHNGYLDIVLQLGIVGGVLFLVVLLSTLLRLWRMPASPATLWAVFLMTVLALAAVTESAPFTQGTGLLSILLIATACLQARSHPPVVTSSVRE